MNEINYRPIGIIHSPFRDIEGTPIQPTGAEGIQAIVEVFKEYCAGLRDLAGFSHIILAIISIWLKGIRWKSSRFWMKQPTGFLPPGVRCVRTRLVFQWCAWSK